MESVCPRGSSAQRACVDQRIISVPVPNTTNMMWNENHRLAMHLTHRGSQRRFWQVQCGTVPSKCKGEGKGRNLRRYSLICESMQRQHIRFLGELFPNERRIPIAELLYILRIHLRHYRFSSNGNVPFMISLLRKTLLPHLGSRGFCVTYMKGGGGRRGRMIQPSGRPS